VKWPVRAGAEEDDEESAGIEEDDEESAGIEGGPSEVATWR
jgi:hypothetical protein